jgi:serine/threonine-protein kinase
MTLSPGTAFGAYEIVALIGAGGMGEVYRARDTRLDRTVAIKVLPPALAGDPSLRIRFEREARAIAALDHPHICALYDVGDQEGIHFLVMPHLEGETLASRLRTRGPLPLDLVFKTAIEIADALERAHRAGITHRDLKPANIMLTRNGAKLLDFGLAKLRAPAPPISMSGVTEAHSSSPHTAEGSILGTVQYMSPEQIDGGDADARSDIWALGALIYEMATGQRAFAGQTPASVIGAVLRDTPDPISKHQRLAPAAFDELVATCLAKDPDERWQHVGDVKRQLILLAASPTRPQPTSVVQGSMTRARLPVLLTSGALMLAAVAGAVAWRASTTSVEPARMELGIAPPDGIRFTGAAALSPDGKHVVFVGLSNGPPSLYLRALQSPVARIIPGTDDASYPFWSPRSDAVGFFAEGRLKTIAIAGGTARNIAAAQNGRGAAWGTNGTILYVPEPNSPVMMIPESGGTATAITNLDTAGGEIGHRWPTFIDDSSFLFTVQSAKTDTTGIYVGTRGSQKPIRLARAYSNSIFSNDHLLYVSDGMIVAHRFDRSTNQLTGSPIELAGPAAFASGLGFLRGFSVSGTGLLSYAAGSVESATAEIEWFDRTSKSLGRLGPNNELSRFNSFNLRLSPSNRLLALSLFTAATGDLWLVDLDREIPSRFTFDAATELNPVWSPDGSELVYSSNRGGFYNLYRKSISQTGGERQVASAPSHQYATNWLRDGTIVFTNFDSKTKSDIWRASATGEWKPAPILATSFNELAAQVSPDGKWISYTSDESGRMEIYLQRFPEGGDKVKVSTEGGSESAWRADSRELFYLAPNRTIMSVPITTAAAFAVGRPSKLLDRVVDTSIGSIHAIHYAATSDGQRFLMTATAGDEAPLNLIVNWPLALER